MDQRIFLITPDRFCVDRRPCRRDMPQCHVRQQFQSHPAPTAFPCHRNDYNGALSPVNHPQPGRLSRPRHADLSRGLWCTGTIEFSDHALDGFTLTGAPCDRPPAPSATLEELQFTNATAVPCHQTDYNGTTNPPICRTDRLPQRHDQLYELHGDFTSWINGPDQGLESTPRRDLR